MTTDPSTKGPVRSGGRIDPKALMGSAPHEQIAAAIAGGHDGRAVELLLQHGERMLVDGRASELHGWLEALPDSVYAGQYRLGLLAAWVHVYQQRFRDALARVALAERALQTRIIAHEGAHRGADLVTRPFDEAQAAIAAVKAHLRAVSGEAPASEDGVDAMMLPASADHPVWRAEALVVLARTRLLGGALDKASRDLSDAVALAGSSGAPRARKAEGEARVLLARGAALEGRFAEALAEAEAVDARCGTAYAASLIARARLAYERLDLARAERLLAEASQVKGGEGCDLGGDPLTVLAEGAIVEALVAALRGDHAHARSRIDELERALKDADLRWLGELVLAARFRLAMIRGDAPLIRRQLQQQATVHRPGARSVAEIERIVASAGARCIIGEAGAGVAEAHAAAELADAVGARALADEARLYEGLGLIQRDRSQPQGPEVLRASLRALADSGRRALIAPWVERPEALDLVSGDGLEEVRDLLASAIDAAREALSHAEGGGAGIGDVEPSTTAAPAEPDIDLAPAPEDEAGLQGAPGEG